MLSFASFIVAMVLTMALIPPLVRYSARLRLIDEPGQRKVHALPVPRVGGICMVAGMLLPVFLWIPLDQTFRSILAGIGVLSIFGFIDDRGDMDYRLKLLGQFLAAIVVVFYGGVVINVIPLLGLDHAPYWFSVVLTLIAIVGVTNSINLADGLDGLAAGIMLLSLSGMAFLAYQAEGDSMVVFMLAVMGSIVGFLRFNTYPARIFMGDTGSQYLGFTVVTLLIILTQNTNPALSPALPLLLLGLPLFDTAFVVFKRLYVGKSPFVADKNHVHHQLLALKLDHYEAVAVIYIVQAAFVVSAVLLRYHPDMLIIAVWLAANLILAALLLFLERIKWQFHKEKSESPLSKAISKINKGILRNVAMLVLLVTVSSLLLAGPVLVDNVGHDVGLAAGALFVLMFTRVLIGKRAWFIPLRLLMFVAVSFVLYLLSENEIQKLTPGGYIEYVFFGVVIVALIIGAYTSREDVFKATTMDVLLILIMLCLALIPQVRSGNEDTINLVIKIFIMFYAVEFSLRYMKGKWNLPALSALWAFGILGLNSVIK